MMNLRWVFPQNFLALAQSVESLNENLDRKLVNMTMSRTGVEREEAERIVRQRVEAELAKTMAKLEVGVI